MPLTARGAKISLLFIICLLRLQLLVGQVDFPLGSTFRYLKGSDAASLATDWMNPDFDDSSWSEGSAPFWYGDGSGGTSLSDMQNNYSVLYLRSAFSVMKADSLKDLLVFCDYDDGFVMWINGHMVLSQFAPLVLSIDALASGLHESGQLENYSIDPDDLTLVEGENTLAIQAFNYDLESSDFHINIGMNAGALEPALVDSIGLAFSVPSGFYTDPFELQITAADPSWNVVYTLDGSNPRDSETARRSFGAATLQIDPGSSEGRPLSPAVVLRASAELTGILPAFPESRTYIFPEEVLTQDFPGGGWPDSSVNGQHIDLPMDPKVVNSPEYASLMIPSLLDIPSISLVTELDHLFESETGIYVNAMEHGPAWERECSLELIQPDGSGGFVVNAGLRIRGGYSRLPEFPKHAFRLFFRSDYGDAKLFYPLFEDEGVDFFDKIDLRTAQNYAWSSGDARNTFLRDVFSRDTQRDMGRPYTRSRYYHLYLNGMYWGLYQSQERAEARYAASYWGGSSEDYDVIKVDTEGFAYVIEATDGNLDGWFDLYELCGEGFESNENYFRLEGKDPGGKPVKEGKIHVDVDNLIDYMMVIFYTGNFDAPTSSFGENKGPNNFYAIDDREDYSTGFRFFAHDAEHTMFADAFWPASGIYEDRVNLAARNDGTHMEVPDFLSFHPQWLHHRLSFNEEYRMRFRDRAHRHLNASGSLTPEQMLGRLNSRIDQIDQAIVAESARWGDTKTISWAYTRDDHWFAQIEQLRNEFLPNRGGIVIDQLVQAGLYSPLKAPVAYLGDEVVSNQVLHLEQMTAISLENSNGAGTLWFTMDGRDPRSVGGSIAEGAESSSDLSLIFNLGSTEIIKARIRVGGEWSPLTEIVTIANEEDYSGLAITELHYHPWDLVLEGDTLFSKDLEFIEFKNTGISSIHLSGLFLDSAVYYEFPEDALLAPGQFYVVASKPSSFYRAYGLVPSGNFKGNFSNAGEEVLLRDQAGNILIHFIYSDDLPWPQYADGGGHSMVTASRPPVGVPADPAYWRDSGSPWGSPFADDLFGMGEQIAENEDSDIRLYPNPTSGTVYIELMPGRDDHKNILELYGVKGKLLYQQFMDNNCMLNLEEMALSPGLYIIRIQTGMQVHTKKLIYR